ncbi:hypothetical protein B0I35DRAFT_422199 [Stachybotrys elegans]|uniref:Uncharacterized protein n=1 Tax=Stachybotrys elegans TaxID=80388 RepID=A0A8K0WV14_9HYPO|nr:hypothetical protein B0I35DRAFT_422199 [Stachybotrys elegans]
MHMPRQCGSRHAQSRASSPPTPIACKSGSGIRPLWYAAFHRSPSLPVSAATLAV